MAAKKKKKTTRKKTANKKLGDVQQLFVAAQTAVENGEKVIRSLGVLDRLIRGRQPSRVKELEEENAALRKENAAMTKFISAALQEAQGGLAFTSGKPLVNFEIQELNHNIAARWV